MRKQELKAKAEEAISEALYLVSKWGSEEECERVTVALEGLVRAYGRALDELDVIRKLADLDYPRGISTKS